MKMGELTPEERAEVIRLIEEYNLGVEPGDEMEIYYYLFPVPREVTDEPNNKAGKTKRGPKKVSDSRRK
jgi:hypothetical protein